MPPTPRSPSRSARPPPGDGSWLERCRRIPGRALKAVTRVVEDPLVRSELRGRVHDFGAGDESVLFVRDSLSVLACSPPLANALRSYLGGTSRLRACRAAQVPESRLEELLALLLARLERPRREAAVERGGKQRLDRLVLNVSNSCNLRCRYCYAQGGSYGGRESSMTPPTARRALDLFLTLFEDGIDKLQFFGGEPFLNIEVIRTVAEELAERTRGGSGEATRLSVVTNGTHLSVELLDLLERHRIRPTISLDGPEEVNDRLRGRGTYRKVVRFVRALEARGIEYSFEGTYTAHHLAAGLEVSDVLDFFRRRFGQREVHIPPVALLPRHPLALGEKQAEASYRRAIRSSLETLPSGSSACLSFASRMSRVLLDRDPIEVYCPAGLATLSVDCEGDVYPCFMFTGIGEMRLGNVFDPRFPDPERLARLKPTLARNLKVHEPACRACWAAPFCSGCLARDYFVTGGAFDRTGCALVRAMAEEFLAHVARSGRPGPEPGSTQALRPARAAVTHTEGGQSR